MHHLTSWIVLNRPHMRSDGPRDLEARERVHSAATIAGMAFANAFLGICHSVRAGLLLVELLLILAACLVECSQTAITLGATAWWLLSMCTWHLAHPPALPPSPNLNPQLAHKLGSAWHVPHGLANALLISHVIRYNSTDRPLKQAAFPQYE